MKKEIVLLELFSGIGGFTKGFIDAGYKIKKHYFSEIDKHAIANYKYNFKNSEYVGSVTDVRGGGIERPDIITFGSPCQDFSLAGKRTGLDGKRSVLILEAIRIITECKPSVFIWENVKGTFSSNNGADFWAIIAAFANIGGYRLEWQLLNTSWFLPQNRERIYLVGHLAGASEPGIFPFTEVNTGITKGSTETPIVRAITAGGHSGGHHSGMTLIKSNTITGYELATEGDSINFSVPTSKTRRGRVGKGKAQTLDTQCNQGVIIGDFRTDEGFRPREDGNSPTLMARARADIQGQPVVMQINPSIESGGKQPYQQNRIYDKDGLSPTIDQAAGRWSVGEVKPVLTPNRTKKRQNGRRFKEDGEPSFTINCQDQHGVMINNNIRRLTEIECERLQGYPDDWTKYGIYEKQVWTNKKLKTFEIVEKLHEIPKTQRYKMCGNAVTTNVVRAIAERLKIY